MHIRGESDFEEHLQAKLITREEHATLTTRTCTKSTRDGVTEELKESLVRWDRFADQRFGESEEDEDGNVTFPVAPTSGKRKRK